MKSIAAIGSLNIDYIFHVPSPPQMGETLPARHMEIMPGGKGANQAYALGLMGACVSMFGAVGNDVNALIEIDNLKSAGVDVSNILHTKTPTGLAMITIDSAGDNSIIVAQGANARVTCDYIDAQIEVLCRHDIIIFQLEIPLETVVHAAKKLKSPWARSLFLILPPRRADCRMN